MNTGISSSPPSSSSSSSSSSSCPSQLAKGQSGIISILDSLTDKVFLLPPGITYAAATLLLLLLLLLQCFAARKLDHDLSLSLLLLLSHQQATSKLMALKTRNIKSYSRAIVSHTAR